MEDVVQRLIKDMSKKFGTSDILTTLNSVPRDVEVISTRLPYLDFALGVGGIPKGRITEIFGRESSGKTSLCQYIIAECQDSGGIVAFIDVEHAVDPIYAELCGVDINNLLFSQPDSGEQALELVEKLLRSGEVDLIVLDSVAQLVPLQEVESDMGNAAMGVKARLMSQALRKITPLVRKSNTALIFTNQVRTNLGVMFGNPETTPGGMALPFAASIRIRLNGTAKTDEKKFHDITIKVVKNKVAPPFKIADFLIVYGKGPTTLDSLLRLCKKTKLISNRGANYYRQDTGEMLCKGKAGLIPWLEEHPETHEELKAICFKTLHEIPEWMIPKEE